MDILILIIIILLSGCFVMAEIAMVSARKAKLQNLAKTGNKRAKLVLKLGADPNKFLSTIQVGITLLTIFASAFGGSEFAGPLAAYFKTIPSLARYSETLGLVSIVLITTYLSLVLGELVPKAIGLNKPESIAMATAPAMNVFSKVIAPIGNFLSASTRLITKLFGLKPSEEPPITEEEIKTLIDQGTQHGVFEESEKDIVKGVFRLSDRKTSTIMTLRTDIEWLDITDTEEQIRQVIIDKFFYSFPVCNGELDEILGVVYTKDVLEHYFANRNFNLQASIKEPLYIHENLSALDLIENFKTSQVHTAIVLDEFGSIQGLVTTHDIMESIVGDMPSNEADSEKSVVQRDDGSLLIDGILPIDELKENLQIHSELPGEDEGHFQTLGGFIITQIGKIPKAGDKFQYGNFIFEIMDMDGNRVDKVLVSLSPDAVDDVD